MSIRKKAPVRKAPAAVPQEQSPPEEDRKDPEPVVQQEVVEVAQEEDVVKYYMPVESFPLVSPNPWNVRFTRNERTPHVSCNWINAQLKAKVLKEVSPPRKN